MAVSLVKDYVVPTITPDMAGCWFNGASSRTADELNACVILSAMHYGWNPDDAAELRELAEATDGWVEDPDAGDWLCESGDAACAYLGSVAPPGYYFEFDDGFYMVEACAVEGFDPRNDECPHLTDCPHF